MTTDPRRPRRVRTPGLTACRLCAGETLGPADTLGGGQLARLRQIEARGLARLTLADCLDECQRGDVVVARPRPGQQRPTARPVWFERLAGDELTCELASWLQAGGPGGADMPPALRALQLRRDV